MSDNSELVKLYGSVLDLCKVKPGEVLAVLTEGGDRAADVDAYLTAAENHAYCRYRQPESTEARIQRGLAWFNGLPEMTGSKT